MCCDWWDCTERSGKINICDATTVRIIMLKRLLLLLSVILWPSLIMAQNVIVTGTITDTQSTPYYNGSLTITLVNTTGQQATFGGSPSFQQRYSATLDNTGSFSI